MTSRSTNRPTHRINLIVDRGTDRDAEFLEIGAAWPTKDGRGLSFQLDVDLRRGDRIFLGEIDWNAIDNKRNSAASTEAAQ